MKKLLLLCLLPVISLAQTQIGNDIDGEAAFDFSGNSVSLSADGTVLAIGAPNNNGNGDTTGHVRVYQNTAGTWTQVGADIDGEGDFDESGKSVSLSADGTVVAIGANGNSNAGHVRVYQNNGGTWTQVGADIVGEATGDLSGNSVSLSADGTVVAIGAPHNNGNGPNGANYGHARVYENVAGTWTQIGMEIDGEAMFDISGSSVSLSSDGTMVAIGAPHNDGNGSWSGHVRVYQNISGVWIQVGDDIDGGASIEQSGFSVSLSANGNVVAIGAPGILVNGSDIGKVRVYQNTAGSWIQVGDDMDGEEAGDNSGWSVSLSSDGTVVAIGAPFNSGNGTDAGHVRVYKNIGGVWTQVGTDIDAEAAGDRSGRSLSLSSDGTKVAIGAFFNDGNGTSSGHVRVYDLSGVLSSDSFVQAHFTVYPNPTASSVTIQLKKGLQLERVNVYSTLGQLVKSGKDNLISVRELAKGSYFLEVITNQGKATKTIVVE